MYESDYNPYCVVMRRVPGTDLFRYYGKDCIGGMPYEKAAALARAKGIDELYDRDQVTLVDEGHFRLLPGGEEPAYTWGVIGDQNPPQFGWVPGRRFDARRRLGLDFDRMDDLRRCWKSYVIPVMDPAIKEELDMLLPLMPKKCMTKEEYLLQYCIMHYNRTGVDFVQDAL